MSGREGIGGDAPVRPPYDPELESSLVAAGAPYVLDFDPASLGALREEIRVRSLDARRVLEQQGLFVTDLHAIAADGHAVPVHHVFSPEAGSPRPCIVYIHGGGMVLGSPWDSASEFSRWIEDFGVSVITIDYRLAPTVQAPTLVEDCYAALEHVSREAASLGIDPDCIIIAGLSAGGGLAAGTALLSRDRNGPRLLGQLLLAPMLDPDGTGESMRQVPDGPWNRAENAAAWRLVLGDLAPDEVGHNAPGRTEWLGALPPAFLEVGSAEIFRSEVVDYAERIWRVGGAAELHVWSGGFHGFSSYSHAAVSQAAIESRRNWLGRLFGYGPQEAPGR